MTSNNRGAISGDPIIANVILIRLLQHSTTVNIRGESSRLKVHRRARLMAGWET